MLRIYDVCLELVPLVGGLASPIALRDRDHARQLRRSMLSVSLNVAEGSGCDGGTRRQRYKAALGSAKETIANLECAQAAGYVQLDPAVRDKLEHVKATLINVVHGKR